MVLYPTVRPAPDHTKRLRHVFPLFICPVLSYWLIIFGNSLETVLHTGWNMTIVSRSHIGLYFHMSCTFHMFLCVCLAPSSCTFQVAPNGPHTSGPSSTASRRSSAKSSGSQPAMAPETMGCVPGTVSGSQKTCLKKKAHSDTNKGWHSCRPNHPTARILALSFLSHPVRIMIQTSESALATPRRASQKGVAQGRACDWVVVGMISPGRPKKNGPLKARFCLRNRQKIKILPYRSPK